MPLLKLEGTQFHIFLVLKLLSVTDKLLNEISSSTISDVNNPDSVPKFESSNYTYSSTPLDWHNLEKRYSHPIHLITEEHIVPTIHWETTSAVQGNNSTVQRTGIKSEVRSEFNSVAELKKAVSECVRFWCLTVPPAKDSVNSTRGE